MSAFFGLDISTSSFKVAEARLDKNGFELRAFGEIKAPASILDFNADSDKKIMMALEKLLKSAKVSSRNVNISIPESEAYARVIEIPVLSDEELSKAIKFEAEQYIPIPIKDAYMQHQVIYRPPKGGNDKRMEVLLVAAKRRVVDRILKLVEKIGLTPVVLETALMSAMRSLTNQLSEFSLLVDIGNNTTDSLIIQNGRLKQTSSLATAGESLTRAISQNLALPMNQARKYKHVYGLDKTQLEGKIYQAIEAPINQIVEHLVSNMRFVKSLGQDSRIDQIVVSGGTALLPGLSHYLVENLDIEVILANPFQQCINTNLPQQLMVAAPRFASVVGLAIRK